MRLKIYSLTILLGELLSMVAAGSSHAKTVAHTYPAVDDSDLPSMVVATDLSPEDNAKDESPFKQSRQLVEKKMKGVPATSNASVSSKYDAVPAGYADSISARLKIVDKLVRDYGRAYDYRTLTSSQLEAILSQLETEKQSHSLN